MTALDLTTMTLTLAPVDAGLAFAVSLIAGIFAAGVFASFAQRWL